MPELHHEAGLSLYVESQGKNILFDTGSSGKFAENAAQLGIDLSKVDYVVISHAHFDHTGGLENFFSLNATAKVYIKEEAREKYFYKVFFLKKYIGTNSSLFSKYADRFIFVNDDLKIDENIYLISRIGTDHQIPSDSKHLLAFQNGRLVVDSFSHEQILIVNEGSKTCCFTGCSHHGIENMVAAAQKYASENEMTVVGGFHMYNPLTKGLSEKKATVIAVGQRLKANSKIGKIVTGHCTGNDAFGLLKTVLDDQLVNLTTGSVIQL